MSISDPDPNLSRPPRTLEKKLFDWLNSWLCRWWGDLPLWLAPDGHPCHSGHLRQGIDGRQPDCYFSIWIPKCLVSFFLCVILTTFYRCKKCLKSINKKCLKSINKIFLKSINKKCLKSINKKCVKSIDKKCLKSIDKKCLKSIDKKCLKSINKKCLKSINKKCLKSINNVFVRIRASVHEKVCLLGSCCFWPKKLSPKLFTFF